MDPDRARRINENAVRIVQDRMARKLIMCQRGTWTYRELHEAFSSVQNRLNWKGPIKATTFNANVDLVLDAIDFIAGGNGHVDGPVDFHPNRVWIVAPGYYVMVGA